MVGEGFDGVFGLLGQVVDEGAEEAPFLEGGGDGLRLVRRGDCVAVAGNDLQEVVHVFKDFVVRGPTVEGACAESMNGCGFAGGRGGVRYRSFERCRCGFIDQVGGGGDEGHGEGCIRSVSLVFLYSLSLGVMHL